MKMLETRFEIAGVVLKLERFLRLGEVRVAIYNEQSPFHTVFLLCIPGDLKSAHRNAGALMNVISEHLGILNEDLFDSEEHHHLTHQIMEMIK